MSAHVAEERDVGEVLEAHRFNKGLARCNCGVELGGRGDRMRAWRTHVARIVVAVCKRHSDTAELTAELAAAKAELELIRRVTT